MLSRTADNLYWMARYVERAEDLARLAESRHYLSLLPVGDADGAADWETLLEVAGDREEFLTRYETITPEAVIAYLVVDLASGSSILSAIRAARENARATRHAMPTELWEGINHTWLEVQDLSPPRLMEMGVQEFLEWIKERSHLFRGIVYGTMRRGEPFLFCALGTFIERADNTARLLQSYRMGSGHTTRGVVEYYRWGALLRAMSAMKTYRVLYRAGIEPKRVAELLVLQQEMPRSLHACFDEIVELLEELGDRGEALRLAKELHARLHYGRIDDIVRTGLGDFLGHFIVRNNQLGIQIQRDFLMIP